MIGNGPLGLFILGILLLAVTRQLDGPLGLLFVIAAILITLH